MRSIILLAVIVSCLVVGFRFVEQSTTLIPSFQQSDANVGFEWAFGVLKSKGKIMVPISLTRDTVLNSGDEIKMMVKLTRDCYVYVVYYDSNGEVSLLFPYTIRQFQTDYKMGKNYYIPKGRNWMKLDKKTGEEKFYLVASAERLLELEVKLGNYFSADPSKRKPLAADVVSEIRGQRKHYSTFATIAEKPLTIGGNIRRTDTLKVVYTPSRRC